MGEPAIARDEAISRLARLRQTVQELDVGANRAVYALDFGILGFDDVVLVGGVRAASVAEAKRAGREMERLSGEHVAGPRARAARKSDRIDPVFAIHLGFNADECGVGGGGGVGVSARPSAF